MTTDPALRVTSPAQLAAALAEFTGGYVKLSEEQNRAIHNEQATILLRDAPTIEEWLTVERIERALRSRLDLGIYAKAHARAIRAALLAPSESAPE